MTRRKAGRGGGGGGGGVDGGRKNGGKYFVQISSKAFILKNIVLKIFTSFQDTN